MKAYESFSDWKNDQSEDNKKLISALESLIKKIAPHFEKSVKWGQGCWIFEEKPRAYIHTESDYIQLGFYNGSSLDDPKKLLQGKGKFIRFVIIEDTQDIDESALTDLLKQVKE
ncbi:MAG: DUF1801 domain-containing protein [Patescibacteria group bacterium]